VPHPESTSARDAWSGRARRLRAFAVTAALALAAAASAQVHESVTADHVLRGNVVGSMALPEPQARQHGIPRDPEHAVLNVVVLRRGTPTASVRARVEARLVGATSVRHLPMREVAANGGISYVGSFRFAPGTMVDVIVEARPAGTQRTLSLRFEDRLPEARAR
jgi:hypothetical protein